MLTATGVSDDGNVIAGWGYNPSGAEEGWIARLNTVLGDPDFNNDGQLNCTDIDALVAEIAAGTNSSLFDLTGDGLVDIADLDEWRVQGGAANLPSGNPYLPGDANLDSAVDASDFNIWNSHRLSQTPAWCAGDFKGRRRVGLQRLEFPSADVVRGCPSCRARAGIAVAGSRRHGLAGGLPPPWVSLMVSSCHTFFGGTVIRPFYGTHAPARAGHHDVACLPECGRR